MEILLMPTGWLTIVWQAIGVTHVTYCRKKGKILYIFKKKSYLELSFHFSNIFGNHLVSYPKGWREAGPDLVCGM